MTDEERNLLRAYLLETRRHYLALAKACEVMMQAMTEDKSVYNIRVPMEGMNTTMAGVKEFREGA